MSPRSHPSRRGAGGVVYRKSLALAVSPAPDCRDLPVPLGSARRRAEAASFPLPSRPSPGSPRRLGTTLPCRVCVPPTRSPQPTTWLPPPSSLASGDPRAPTLSRLPGLTHPWESPMPKQGGARSQEAGFGKRAGIRNQPRGGPCPGCARAPVAEPGPARCTSVGPAAGGPGRARPCELSHADARQLLPGSPGRHSPTSSLCQAGSETGRDPSPIPIPAGSRRSWGWHRCRILTPRRHGRIPTRHPCHPRVREEHPPSLGAGCPPGADDTGGCHPG